MCVFGEKADPSNDNIASYTKPLVIFSTSISSIKCLNVLYFY